MASQLKPHSPADAIDKGLGLLTESRKDDGLVLPLSVKENMTIASLDKYSDFSWLHPCERSARRRGVCQTPGDQNAFAPAEGTAYSAAATSRRC